MVRDGGKVGPDLGTEQLLYKNLVVHNDPHWVLLHNKFSDSLTCQLSEAHWRLNH